MKTDSCPTCGSICKVVGNVTMHYEPIGTSKVVKDILDAKYKDIVDKIDEMIKEDTVNGYTTEVAIKLSELKQYIKELKWTQSI